MAAGDKYTDPNGIDVILVDVGQEIILENDEFRVWSIVLNPGETQPWHKHHHPYLVVAIQEAHNRIDPISGAEPKFVHETIGRVIFREPGEVHMLTNNGDSIYESKLIEYLGTRVD